MSRQYVSLDMAQLSMTWHTWRSHLKHTAWHCHVLSKCPAIIISAITHTSRKVLYVLQSREVIFFGKSDCWWIASMKCWSWCSLTTWGQVCVKKLVWMNLYCRTKKKLILEEKAFISVFSLGPREINFGGKGIYFLPSEAKRLNARSLHIFHPHSDL